MLGQVASSGFTPMVSICFQINLPVLYFTNYSPKTCKASKGQTSSFLGGMYLCIYRYPYTDVCMGMTQRKYILRQKEKKKDSFSFKTLRGLI